eukprot:11542629-Ditylum_brightwellii.AAC.1
MEQIPISRSTVGRTEEEIILRQNFKPQLMGTTACYLLQQNGGQQAQLLHLMVGREEVRDDKIKI